MKKNQSHYCRGLKIIAGDSKISTKYGPVEVGYGRPLMMNNSVFLKQYIYISLLEAKFKYIIDKLVLLRNMSHMI